MPRRGLEIVPVDPMPSDCEGFPEVVLGAIDREMSRPAVLMHQTHGCSHKTQAFSPKFLSNSRKQRFLAGSSRHAHMPTPQPASSPPRLPCRSPGPGPSVASPSCPKPHLSRVSKLTPARDATERARDCPGGPMPSDCEGISEVIIGAIDRDMARPAALMRRTDACSHNM